MLGLPCCGREAADVRSLSRKRTDSPQLGRLPFWLRPDGRSGCCRQLCCRCCCWLLPSVPVSTGVGVGNYLTRLSRQPAGPNKEGHKDDSAAHAHHQDCRVGRAFAGAFVGTIRGRRLVGLPSASRGCVVASEGLVSAAVQIARGAAPIEEAATRLEAGGSAVGIILLLVNGGRPQRAPDLHTQTRKQGGICRGLFVVGRLLAYRRGVRV